MVSADGKGTYVLGNGLALGTDVAPKPGVESAELPASGVAAVVVCDPAQAALATSNPASPIVVAVPRHPPISRIVLI